MNPLFQEFLTTIIKWALGFVFAFLVSKGILTQEESALYITGAVGFFLTVIWALWAKYKDRLKFMTALATPKGTTERQVEQLVKEGDAPPANLPKHASPYLPSDPPVKR